MAQLLIVRRGFADSTDNHLSYDWPAVRTPQLAVAQSKFSRVLVIDKRASSLSAGENAVCFEEVERLAHCAGANAELSRQLSLVRDYAARLPLASGNPRQERVAQLHIKWAY